VAVRERERERQDEEGDGSAAVFGPEGGKLGRRDELGQKAEREGEREVWGGFDFFSFFSKPFKNSNSFQTLKLSNTFQLSN
jgi:hypothetical protein